MNNVQRRLFRAFAESGGDLSDDDQVQHFIRCVESQLMLLPQKVREGVELVWRGKDGVPYDRLVAELARRGQMQVTVASLRQRVSRGARLLEDAVRHGPWGRAAETLGKGGPRARGDR